MKSDEKPKDVRRFEKLMKKKLVKIANMPKHMVVWNSELDCFIAKPLPRKYQKNFVIMSGDEVKKMYGI